MNLFYLTFLSINVGLNAIESSANPVTRDEFPSDDRLQCSSGSSYGNAEDKNILGTFEGSDRYQVKAHPKYEVPSEKLLKRRSLTEEKSPELSDLLNEERDSIQKRQVGVIYRDNRPIGILQPYQRSYRFIPVKEESPSFPIAAPVQESIYSPSSGVDKRDLRKVEGDSSKYVEETYPSILASFKIDSRLHAKRDARASYKEKDIDVLKDTIRTLRSAKSEKSELVEEKLKGILDDMGLIEEDEAHGGKREIAENEGNTDEDNPSLSMEEINNDRNKREQCTRPNRDSDSFSSSTPKSVMSLEDKQFDNANEMISDKREASESDETEETSRRRKRQREAPGNTESELIEDLKDSGELMVSGNKSPLASSSSENAEKENGQMSSENKQPVERAVENDDNESRIEKQIQDRINSLKEEVKREIDALRRSKEERRRRKRHSTVTLVDEETDEVNPVMNPDVELKPLIRKRRSFESDNSYPNDNSNTTNSHVRKKRQVSNREDYRYRRRRRGNPKHNLEPRRQPSNKFNTDENEEGGELLGDDDLDEKVAKREAFDGSEHFLDNDEEDMGDGYFERGKRSRPLGNNGNFFESDAYNDQYSDDDFERFRRDDVEGDEEPASYQPEERRLVGSRPKPAKASRLKRRIFADELEGRPQQLSDMSDVDLFGALPKSYDGELSRYKRVK